MNYRILDPKELSRSGVYRHFTEDCHCSTSMTASLDVTALRSLAKTKGRKFHIDFLYLLTKTINSREVYRLGYRYKEKQLVCFDQMNPTHYVFREDSETCTPVYTEYDPNYEVFYKRAYEDIEKAKKSEGYSIDEKNHENYFDASYISWITYDSFNIELPDGYLYFQPIINWGRYKENNGVFLMPFTLRMNHAVADGFHVANFFRLLQKEIDNFCKEQ